MKLIAYLYYQKKESILKESYNDLKNIYNDYIMINSYCIYNRSLEGLLSDLNNYSAVIIGSDCPFNMVERLTDPSFKIPILLVAAHSYKVKEEEEDGMVKEYYKGIHLEWQKLTKITTEKFTSADIQDIQNKQKYTLIF